MDYLTEVKRFHASAVEPYTGKAVGCDWQEIVELEKQIGFPLPEAYRLFLRWMGKDCEGIFRGSDWFLADVIDNTKYLPELLAENHVGFDLPEHYLVFFSHQGYMAAWFNLPKESENPTCYFYSECEMDSPRVEGKFTDVLLKDMRGLAPLLPETRRRRK